MSKYFVLPKMTALFSQVLKNRYLPQVIGLQRKSREMGKSLGKGAALQAEARLLGRAVSITPPAERLDTSVLSPTGAGEPILLLFLLGRGEAHVEQLALHLQGSSEESRARRQGGGERAGGERRIFFTCSRRKSWGLKSFGEHPHQSTMCLYWHLQPSLRFQLVTRRLLSTSVSQAWLFSRTVWKKDCMAEKGQRHSGDGGWVLNGAPYPSLTEEQGGPDSSQFPGRGNP